MKRFLSFAIVVTMLCMAFAIETLNAAPPSTQAYNIALSNVTSASARITVTRGNGTDRIIVVRLASDAEVAPTDGHPYTVSSSNFSSPDSITGAGNKVMYSGTARAVLVTGLSAGMHYIVTVYERNNGAYEYNTSTANNNPRDFYTVPAAPAASAYSNVASNSFTANWTAPATGNFDGYIISVANNSSFSPSLNWYDNLSLGATGTSYDVESVSTPPTTTISSNTTYYARIRSTYVDKMSGWVNLGSVVTLPVAPTLSASSVTICQGDGYTIAPIGPTPIGNGLNERRFNVYSTPTGGSPINVTPQTTITVNPLTDSTFYVATFSNLTGLESATRTSITIHVNPSAAPADAGPDSCYVGTLVANLAGSSASPGTGVWSLVSGPGSVTYAPNANTNNAGVTVSAYGTYVFQWTVSVSGCTTTSDQVSFTFNQAVVPASITTSSPVNLCSTLSTAISAVNPGGGSGTWSYTSTNGGTLTFTPNTSSPNATITSSGYDSYEVVWTVTNPCTGSTNSADTITVNFDQTPTTADAGADQDNCAPGSAAANPATLAANSPALHETGTWTAAGTNPGTTTFSNTNSPTSTATVSAYGLYKFYWTITSQFGVCSASVDSVMVGIYAPPSTAVDGGPYNGACGSMSATLNATSPAVGNGMWTIITSPSGSNPSFDDGSLPNATLSSDMFGAYTVVWTVSTIDGTCPASSDTTTVNLLQNATIATAGADQNFCGLSGSLAANTPSIGTGSWSVVSGNAGDISFSNTSSPTSGVTSTNYGAYSFKWTITNGTCSTMDTVGVVFWQTPTANAGPDQPTVCAPMGGPYTASLAATTPAVGTGLWQRISGPGSASFSNVNSATSSVTFTASGTYGLKWTVTNGPCSAVDTVYVTIIQNIAPSAAGTIGGSNSVCPNTTGAYSVGTISGAATYNWSVPSDASIVSGSGTNMITVNFGTTSGNITVAGVNVCGTPGTSSTLAVTVLPAVGTAATPSGSSSVCQGQSGVTYSVGTISGATTYNWSVPSGASIVGSSTGNSITVNYSTSASPGTVIVYGSNSCGTGIPGILPVTVNSIPTVAGTISGTQMVCQNSTGVTYSVASIGNATSYVWTVPTGASIASGSSTNMITVNFGTSSGNVTVAGVNTCGTGTSSTLAISVSAPVGSAGPISGTQTVCQNTTGMAYSVASIANATSYLWTVPTDASITAGSNTNMITVNFGTTSGNVTVAGSNVCGSGASASLAISIEQPVAAAGTVMGTTTICAGSTTSYSVGTIANATSYVWSVPSGAAITSGSSTNMITVNLGTASGNVTVYGMNSCGAGTSNSLAVTVENPVSSSTPTITGTASVCEGQTNVTYSIASLPNATSYNWSVPSGASIVSGSNTNMITVNYGTTSGNVTVYGSNSCGSGGMGTLAVTVNTLPSAAGAISGSNPVCANTAGEIYSVAAISGATSYVWSLPTGATFTGASTGNMVTVNFGTNSGSIGVYGMNSCGTGSSNSLAVTIESPVGSAATPSGSATACQASVQTYSVAPIANATSYTWTLPSGASIASGSGTNMITVNFGSTSGSVSVFGSNSCGAGASGALTVTIDLPVAAASVPVGSATVCANEAGVAYSVSPIAHATSYVWSLPAGASIASGSGTNMITVNFGSTAGNITVYGTNTCGSGSSNTLAVSINPLPSVAGSISGPNAVCANTAGVEYSVASIANATSYVWSVPTDASIVGGSGTNMITVNFGTSSGNVAVYGMNACGSGTPNSMAVTIESPVGSAATPSGSATACQASVQIYSVAPITNATSYTWTLPAGANIASGSNTNMITVNFGSTSGSVSVFGSNSCGAGTSGALTVTIDLPVAAATAPSGNTLVCANESGVVYTASPIAHATSYVWTVPTGATIASQSGNAVTVNFGSTAGNVTVAGVNACGTGTSASLSVAINPLPSAAGTISGSSSACANQTGVTYSVGSIANATGYVWSVPSDASIVSGSGTNMITVNFGTTNGSVSVYGINACGSGTSNSTSVTVIQQVAAASTPSGSATVCSGQTGVTYSTSVLPNATSYVWTLPSGATIANGSGTNMITVNFGSTGGNVSVYGMNSCFSGTSASLSVSVTLPVASATTPVGAASVCPNQTGVMYSVASVSNATSYVWTLPAGATIASGSGTNMITVNFGSTSGNVTVYGMNSCFSGGSAFMAVVVNPLPSSAGAITGTTSICANSTGIIYTVGTVSNATSYAWTLPAGATFSGSSTGNSVTVNFGSASGNVTVAGVNSCGTGTSSSLPVSVSALITANAGADQSIGGLNGTMAGNAAAPGVGTWTKISGPGTVTFSNANSATSNVSVSAFGTYTLRWTIVNGSCTSFDDVDLTFNSAPTQLAFQVIATPQVTGVAFNVVVESQDGTGTPTNVSSNTSFTITENGAGSLQGGSVTGTILAGHSNSGAISVTYNAVDNTVGEAGVTLHVDDDGGPLTDNNSNAINILPIEPSTQASNIQFTSRTQFTMGLSWTRGNGANCLVYVKQGPSSNPDVPTDGSSYSADVHYQSGSSVGTSYAIYKGTGTSVTAESLSNDTRYAYKVVEFNGSGSLTNYNTSNASGNSNNRSWYTLSKEITDPQLPQTGGAMNMSASAFKPNPARDYVEFNVNLAFASNVTVLVYDEAGNLVVRALDNVSFVKGSTPVRIDLKGLASGAYTVVISANNEAITDKIIINK